MNLPPGVSHRTIPGLYVRDEEVVELDVMCLACNWFGVAENFEGEIDPAECPQCGEELARG